ncbi:MAG: hypothetical protein ACOX8S_08255 [Christensenellales bacterium]
MFTPETSGRFEKYVHPETGVVSYLLKNETAPFQKLFHPASHSATLDGRYCWILCAHPPGGWMEGSALTAACIDFETDEIYRHPDIRGDGACAAPLTGELYFQTDNLILRKGPRPDAQVDIIAKVPAEWRVFPGRMATHLTFSADRTKLCCDIASGNDIYIAGLDIASGEFELWRKLHGGWSHAQFSPADNDLILLAMDRWQDIKTGLHHDIPYDDKGKRARCWTIRRGENPVLHPPLHSECSHEWWSAGGKHIYYCDEQNGIGKINLQTGEHSMFYTSLSSHGHSCADGSFLCTGKIYPGGAARASFHSIRSAKSVVMLESPAAYHQGESSAYDIGPHPRFVFGDRYIAQSTTLNGPGKLTVAFTNVDQLRRMTI